jgi:hypothetical protein
MHCTEAVISFWGGDAFGIAIFFNKSMSSFDQVLSF